ncbi:glycoside hydrolase family 28 protein [Belliella sp. DSM 111904]|uniref:Glycoside hydrolase family 28 protein n=1 Tax=Belliella filtrata TaxID=2923435 RepID=A0ABS9UVJ9_9BACT|nr:glycoside hydrolase family 28 protein [Belliella filtrata]MCH7408094.1 glycoside hydrolase family 28 protein [Belliella filtrata]
MWYNKSVLLGCFVAFFSCKSNEEAWVDHDRLELIPHANQVGAMHLPVDIAPINAPFDMPDFKRPVFPDFVINILDIGAKPGEKITDVIQAAIDDVNSAGGGRVIIPKGIWKAGRIILKSNVNLHFEDGAKLYFSGELVDYRPAVFTRHEGVEVMSLGACIYAYREDNIAITGKGILYGPEEGNVREQMMTEDVVENFVPMDIPVSQRVYEGHDGESIFLPMFVSPTECTNVFIEGITLERTAFWNIVPVYCDGVIIRGVTVNSVGIPRGDGIDIESSKNVLIEYATLNNGDDCFTLKAGRGEDGVRVNKATENVVIRHCLAQEGHGGVTVGSETAGWIRNLYVHDCVFDNTGVGIRFKTRRPRGGGGENLYYERIRMNLRHTAFRWDMLGSELYVGELASRFPPREKDHLTPTFKQIYAKDIIVENAAAFINVTGIPESPMENFEIDNAVVNSKQLFRADDAKNMVLKNLEITSQDSVLYLLDAHDIKLSHVRYLGLGDKWYVSYQGDSSQPIKLNKVYPNQLLEID